MDPQNSDAEANPRAESDSDSDIQALFEDNEHDPNTIVTSAPETRFRLGYWSVMGLVINRMIGTGIFNTTSTVMRGTHSVGITLMFWFCGAIYTFAGTYLHIEYGLSTPRHVYEGTEQGIPRSGGALNYLQYVFKWPAYRENTVLLSTTVYGITFLLLGSMAGNCINFAIRCLEAGDLEVTHGKVAGIAISVATAACFIHAFSRRGGIWLSNAFALIKILLLLLIIIVGLCAFGGVFHTKARDIAQNNLAASKAFSNAASDSYGYAQAFLAIIFAYSGFEQPNAVLGEIGRPRKKFPWATSIAVGIVCCLYLAVNVVYMLVVPKHIQIDPDQNVASVFFENTLGTLGTNNSDRILAGFMAISSFGNIIVFTFTASRVKQEIAKEGIIPWPKVFGEDADLSLGKVLKWMHRTPLLAQSLHRLLSLKWLAPEEHSQRTPVGALILHWTFCAVLILATIGQDPYDAYVILTALYSYAIVTVFGVALAVGMLYLRFSTKANWREKSREFNSVFSIGAAFLFGIANLFPLVASWVPPSGTYTRTTSSNISWFTVPTITWSVLGFGVVWWLAFHVYALRRESKDRKVFVVEKIPVFDRDPPHIGPPVQVHETVHLGWRGKDILEEPGPGVGAVHSW